jgi:hypothetical protein
MWLSRSMRMKKKRLCFDCPHLQVTVLTNVNWEDFIEGLVDRYQCSCGRVHELGLNSKHPQDSRALLNEIG